MCKVRTRSSTARKSPKSADGNEVEQPKKLGNGTFGTVIRVGDQAHKYTRDPFDAIKEYIWCSTINHPHIIRHHDLVIKNIKRTELAPSLKKWFDLSNPSRIIEDTDDTIGIIKMNAYDIHLKRLVTKHTLSSSQYDFIIRCIMEAIHYLHINYIVHSDLKPDNVLVNFTNKGDSIEIKDVVVCDLGISNIQKYAEVQNTAPLYQCVDYKPVISHDIYSLGVLIVRIFNPNLKPDKMENEYTTEELKSGPRRALREFRESKYRRFLQAGYDNVPVRYRELVKRMTSVGGSRPNIQECMRALGYQIPKVKSMYKRIYLNDHYNSQLDRDFYALSVNVGLNRARMGCYALREFLHRRNLLKKNPTPSEDAKITEYVTATMIITHSLFGSDKVLFPDITKWRSQVYDLLNDDKFIINITTPTHYVEVRRPNEESKSSSGSSSTNSRSRSKTECKSRKCHA
jgi:serine/threonine protein kinase